MDILPVPKKRVATVESLMQATRTVYVARFRNREPGTMEFHAGQYGSFILGPQTRRTFSFSTSPTHTTSFEIAADITPMGPGSVWLMHLKTGESIEFLGPLGRFIMDYQSPRKPLLVATGTGIAPFRSMLYEYLAKEKQKEITLYWGLRHEEDVFWHEEFSSLGRTHPNFKYILTLSQPKEPWSSYKGRVTDHIYGHHESLSEYDFYLCGNRVMIHEVQEELLSRDVPENQIKTELFF